MWIILSLLILSGDAIASRTVEWIGVERDGTSMHHFPTQHICVVPGEILEFVPAVSIALDAFMNALGEPSTSLNYTLRVGSLDHAEQVADTWFLGSLQWGSEANIPRTTPHFAPGTVTNSIQIKAPTEPNWTTARFTAQTLIDGEMGEILLINAQTDGVTPCVLAPQGIVRPTLLSCSEVDSQLCNGSRRTPFNVRRGTHVRHIGSVR